MKKKILKILQEINSDIADDDNEELLLSGKLDSFDIANLVAALEEEFKIEINAEDIIPENFSTIRNIINLVERGVK